MTPEDTNVLATGIPKVLTTYYMARPKPFGYSNKKSSRNKQDVPSKTIMPVFLMCVYFCSLYYWYYCCFFVTNLNNL